MTTAFRHLCRLTAQIAEVAYRQGAIDAIARSRPHPVDAATRAGDRLASDASGDLLSLLRDVSIEVVTATVADLWEQRMVLPMSPTEITELALRVPVRTLVGQEEREAINA